MVRATWRAAEAGSTPGMTKWVCLPVVWVQVSTTPSKKATSSSEMFPFSLAAVSGESLASSAPTENSRP